MGLHSYLTVVVFHRVSEPTALVLKSERGEIWPTAVRSLLRSMRLICNGGESFKLEFLAGMRAASQRVEALWMCWAL